MTSTAALSADRQTRLYLYLIIAFGLCLRLVYFSEDIGGSHTFRQAMVANQIDSLKTRALSRAEARFSRTLRPDL